MKYKLGIDIGSTTVKLAMLDENNHMIYSRYQRHLADGYGTLQNLVNDCFETMGNIPCTISITGSGGLSASGWIGLPFVQEVIACSKAVEVLIPQTDVAIELGGEDAKITYFRNGCEQRMNSSCAGGTGAFIDQMAVLLNTDAKGLNAYAKKHTMIYPIASRCGVFAKTDVQPLINDGAGKEDIAASILQAVVNQTVGGLACGKPIRGRVAFLGGPLGFLSELRKLFVCSLKLGEGEAITPENCELFTAIGAAMSSSRGESILLRELRERMTTIKNHREERTANLAPLFSDEAEYERFRHRHSRGKAEKGELSDYHGKTYLGIDAGSTTTKAVLIGENGALLYSSYKNNEGNPLKILVQLLKDIYDRLPSDCVIAKSGVTGYGETLMKAALHIDVGEIETVAHYRAAKHFLPEVDFILDIGGQDMKCMRIKDKTIDSILLNEACSSGCGSFIEGFATSLGWKVDVFASEGLFAKSPVDLGTKCTVFMNSKVKQAQKEGAAICDLSAGLSYSVIKNALYKVIKVRDAKDLGNHIMVQGGTFYNDAVLRSFELISGREAFRPEIAGLMGAYGMALIARERFQEGDKTSLLAGELLSDFIVHTSHTRCKKCGNQCQLTVNRFSGGGNFVAGNRCERGLGQESTNTQTLPNLVAYKYDRTFAYQPVAMEKARRGLIGIPRVLNLFENYPFWFTLLTDLGFRVILSEPSSKILYERGLETIPSESVCYPAKLCHGHILNLIDRGVKTIFYPSVAYETKEYKEADNHYNCPVVISYPEVIRHNIDEVKQKGIRFITPFLSLDNPRVLIRRIVEEFSQYHVTYREAREAVEKACKERENYRRDIQRKGEEAFSFLKREGRKGILLCGKPYHTDPQINHGIADLIVSYGLAVLTEDSIAHLAPLTYPLRVVDQWVYNSRLYRAASLAAKEPCLELVQLNSFGCGLDSVTTDQIAELLASAGKMYTMLKIDEGTNLGAARIRLRSLKAAMEERERMHVALRVQKMQKNRPLFTKEMKATHTILAPQMAPIHFELVEEAARSCGYQLEVLPEMGQSAVEEGLKYVNNDACYPAIMMIGQVVQALKSGRYDIAKTSVILVQSGGGCRATNYVAFLKLGMQQAGYADVPIISVNMAGLERQPGFKLSLGLINRCIMAILLGDLLMKVLYRTRPYERFSDSAQLLYQKWNERAKKAIRIGSQYQFHKTVRGMIWDFDHLELWDRKKPKVGVVGEILVKYHPGANNNIIGIIEEGGAEAVVPDLMDYFLYSAYNSRFQFRYLAGKKLKYQFGSIAAFYIRHFSRCIKKELEKSRRFLPPASIEELAEKAATVLSLGNQTGEGWLITAEMMEFIELGTNNILCVQPLACLPNHITGKGMIKPLKERYPGANIIPIDYDPGISGVNQLNRIQLLLSVAMKNGEQENPQ
jgi:activator of 2-hydroxyglutaryl-CoA dehydratase/predicted nucleotide-binding protein (sugar kinase/HSP70/actin superfamily)